MSLPSKLRENSLTSLTSFRKLRLRADRVYAGNVVGELQPIRSEILGFAQNSTLFTPDDIDLPEKTILQHHGVNEASRAESKLQIQADEKDNEESVVDTDEGSTYRSEPNLDRNTNGDPQESTGVADLDNIDTEQVDSRVVDQTEKCEYGLEPEDNEWVQVKSWLNCCYNLKCKNAIRSKVRS